MGIVKDEAIAEQEREDELREEYEARLKEVGYTDEEIRRMEFDEMHQSPEYARNVAPAA